MNKATIALFSTLLAACSLGELESQQNEFIGASAAQYRIIYAAGVGNADFGDDAPVGSPEAARTQETREALAAWIDHEIARDALPSGFAGAPMTMVGNNGIPVTDGPFGGWDDEAIITISTTLSRFARQGIDNVLVVSHSNGVISTQQGYTAFMDELAGPVASPMCIHFHHTQAAGSQIDDFVPRRAEYFDGSNGVEATFRFTYNREDWMTYDPYLLSTVGRRESRPWVDDVMQLAGPIVEQLANPNNASRGGGGGHNQVETLQDLTTPTIVAGYQVESGRIELPSCP